MKHFIQETISLVICSLILFATSLAAVEWALPDVPETPFQTIAKVLE